MIKFLLMHTNTFIVFAIALAAHGVFFAEAEAQISVTKTVVAPINTQIEACKLEAELEFTKSKTAIIDTYQNDVNNLIDSIKQEYRLYVQANRQSLLQRLRSGESLQSIKNDIQVPLIVQLKMRVEATKVAALQVYSDANAARNTAKDECDLQYFDDIDLENTDLNLNTAFMYGDVDRNGLVDAKDVRFLQAYITTKNTDYSFTLPVDVSEAEFLKAADVNNDANVTSADVVFLQASLSGAMTPLGSPIGQGLSSIDMNDIKANIYDGTAISTQLLHKADINLDGLIDEKDMRYLDPYLPYELTMYPIIHGDADRNGLVTVEDLHFLQDIIATQNLNFSANLPSHITEYEFSAAADVNNDGDVTNADVVFLQASLNGAATPLGTSIGKNLDAIDMNNIEAHIYDGAAISTKLLHKADINLDGRIDLQDLRYLEPSQSYATQWSTADFFPIIYGDVDRNGLITEEDVHVLQKYFPTKETNYNFTLPSHVAEEEFLMTADVNHDGDVTSADVELIQ